MVPHFLESLKKQRASAKQLPSLGFIQTRWGHLNEKENLLTRVCGFGLSAHFEIEQVGRQWLGCFLIFNGTAGIWRRRCILSVGSWSGNSLTEDQELAYRAQLAGWKALYINDIACPGEIPTTITSFKRQHYRWTKGGAQNARKFVPKLFKKKLSAKVRWHGIMNLCASSMYICIFISSILTVPLLYFKNLNPEQELWGGWHYFGLFYMFSYVGYVTMYGLSASRDYARKGVKKYFLPALANVFLLLAFAAGAIWNNTRACISGWLGIPSAFIRTPKRGDAQSAGSSASLGGTPYSPFHLLIEAFLAFYFVFGLFYGFYVKDYDFVPAHLLACMGHLTVLYLQIQDWVLFFYPKNKSK